MDLAHSYVQARIRVILTNGDALTNENVGPVNLTLHSLFSEADVYLNTVQINSPSGCYPYQTYLQTLLSYSPEVKNTQLRAAMFFKDTAGYFQSMVAEENEGMDLRKLKIARSSSLEMIGRLHSDLFHQSKYLLPHLDVRIKLNRSKDAFVLMSAPTVAGGEMPRAKVELEEAALFVRKIRVSPVIALAHAKALEKANVVYPLTRTVIRVFSAAAGSFSCQEDNLFVDKLPNKLVVGFVRAEAFNGSLALNPFNFEHLNLNFLSLYHQGQQIPSKGLRPDFQNGRFTRAYMTLFNGTNMAWQNVSHGVTMDDFARGTALYCFDLTPSLAQAAEATEVSKSGPLRLEAQFAVALPAAVNMIVYGEFDGKLEVSRSREVLLL